MSSGLGVHFSNPVDVRSCSAEIRMVVLPLWTQTSLVGAEGSSGHDVAISKRHMVAQVEGRQTW